MLKHLKYGTAAPREISPNTSTRLSNILSSDPMLTKKMTLLQEINYVFFATWQGITSKRITNYIPESEIAVNGHLDQQKQRPVTAADANLTPI